MTTSWTTLALIEHALSHGYREVGWHCWKSNLPSAALALKAGFVHRHDYSVFLCAFDPAVQFGLHGNQRRQDGDYTEALAWYERAFALPSAPAWAYFNAARCLAQLDRGEAALDHLRQACERGFEDADFARSIPEFEQLYQTPTWQTLFG